MVGKSVNAAESEVLQCNRGFCLSTFFGLLKPAIALLVKRLRYFSLGLLVDFLSVLLQNLLERRGGEAQEARERRTHTSATPASLAPLRYPFLRGPLRASGLAELSTVVFPTARELETGIDPVTSSLFPIRRELETPALPITQA